jgi:hypothetical protein
VAVDSHRVEAEAVDSHQAVVEAVDSHQAVVEAVAADTLGSEGRVKVEAAKTAGQVRRAAPAGHHSRARSFLSTNGSKGLRPWLTSEVVRDCPVGCVSCL